MISAYVNHALVDRFAQTAAVWKRKYAPLFGREVASEGRRFRLVSCSPKGVPYFARIREDGGLTAMLFIVDPYNRRWAEGQLAAEPVRKYMKRRD